MCRESGNSWGNNRCKYTSLFKQQHFTTNQKFHFEILEVQCKDFSSIWLPPCILQLFLLFSFPVHLENRFTPEDLSSTKKVLMKTQKAPISWVLLELSPLLIMKWRSMEEKVPSAEHLLLTKSPECQNVWNFTREEFENDTSFRNDPIKLCIQ